MRDAMRIAAEGARAGARVIRERGHDLGVIRAKSSAIDMVTEVDIASGVAVTKAIAALDPHAGFVVEEPEVYDVADASRGDLHDPAVWVIDPIDGTTSFLHGFPCFSVSVAYLEHGVPKAGAVLDVPLDELFTAAEDCGATRNGQHIRCSEAVLLEESLLVTGFPYDRTSTLTRQLRLFSAIVPLAQGVRRDGSAAVDCCHVACGRADAFWELSLQPWDTAAGAIILREAGALMTDLRGEPWTPDTRDIIAANPALHATLLRRLAEADDAPAAG